MTAPTVDRAAACGAMRLTGRQLQALRMVAVSRTQREAAIALGISKEGVQSLLRGARYRLGVATLAEALAVAGRLGLLGRLP